MERTASRPRRAVAACAEGRQKLFPAASARHVLRAGDGSRSGRSVTMHLGLPTEGFQTCAEQREPITCGNSHATSIH
jgi:hypothetical protein